MLTTVAGKGGGEGVLVAVVVAIEVPNGLTSNMTTLDTSTWTVNEI